MSVKFHVLCTSCFLIGLTGAVGGAFLGSSTEADGGFKADFNGSDTDDATEFVLAPEGGGSLLAVFLRLGEGFIGDGERGGLAALSGELAFICCIFLLALLLLLLLGWGTLLFVTFVLLLLLLFGTFVLLLLRLFADGAANSGALFVSI